MEAAARNLRNVLGDRVVDATAAAAAKASELASTNVSKLPGKFRSAAAKNSNLAATRFTAEEATALHRARQLTPEQTARKAELYRLREEALQRARTATRENVPYREAAAEMQRYRGLEDLVRNPAAESKNPLYYRRAAEPVPTPKGRTPMQQQELSDNCGVAAVLQTLKNKNPNLGINQEGLVRWSQRNMKGYKPQLGTTRKGIEEMAQYGGLNVTESMGLQEVVKNMSPKQADQVLNTVMKNWASEKAAGKEIIVGMAPEYFGGREGLHAMTIEAVEAGPTGAFILGDPWRGNHIRLQRWMVKRHLDPEFGWVIMK
jgi:exonuclease VII large subunit